MDGATSQGPVHKTADESAVRAQAEDDDADLRAALAGLSLLATGRLELSDMLTRVAEFAVRAIPGADGAGLTLTEERRQDMIVATAPFVVEVDAIQYGIGQGPCITAAAVGQTVRSADLATDKQWPDFGPRVGRLGVHSVLSLPLTSGQNVLGAMNVYAHSKGAFDDRAAVLGELFAVPAAIAVHNAQVLAQAHRLTAQLQAALPHRAIIDQALGIVMSRAGCSEQEAFDRLRRMSQTENAKVRDAAERIVTDAVRRARARYAAGGDL